MSRKENTFWKLGMCRTQGEEMLHEVATKLAVQVTE
jgi:hypothetical protein